MEGQIPILPLTGIFTVIAPHEEIVEIEFGDHLVIPMSRIRRGRVPCFVGPPSANKALVRVERLLTSNAPGWVYLLQSPRLGFGATVQG